MKNYEYCLKKISDRKQSKGAKAIA